MDKNIADTMTYGELLEWWKKAITPIMLRKKRYNSHHKGYPPVSCLGENENYEAERVLMGLARYIFSQAILEELINYCKEQFDVVPTIPTEIHYKL